MLCNYNYYNFFFFNSVNFFFFFKVYCSFIRIHLLTKYGTFVFFLNREAGFLTFQILGLTIFFFKSYKNNALVGKFRQRRQQASFFSFLGLLRFFLLVPLYFVDFVVRGETFNVLLLDSHSLFIDFNLMSCYLFRLPLGVSFIRLYHEKYFMYRLFGLSSHLVKNIYAQLRLIWKVNHYRGMGVYLLSNEILIRLSKKILKKRKG